MIVILSRRDIEKELGKGLSIYPFHSENIKENSLNVTISDYAWCQSDMTVYWYGDNDFSIIEDRKKQKLRTHTFRKGEKSIFIIPKSFSHGVERKYLILCPHQTTLLETEEVIGIGNTLGGAVHSKVGIVANGVGDTGTMLGPGYCGHLMISLHNITNDIVALPVGDTFVSLTFDYLTTQVVRTSATVSGHYDRLLEHGCTLTSEDKRFFEEDWKSNFGLIQEKMSESADFKEYKKKMKKGAWKEFRKYINKKNIIAICCVFALFFGLYFLARYIDDCYNQTTWVDRFWNIGCSGLLGTVLVGLWRFLRDKK